MSLLFIGNSDFQKSSSEHAAIISGGSNTILFQSNTTNVITINSNSDVIFNSNSAFVLPIGNTANRPTGANGMMRYSTDKTFEVYLGGNWTSVTTSYNGQLLVVGGGGGGGGSSNPGGGGGGAGGYVSGTIVLVPGETYFANVGIRGLGTPAGTSSNGQNGNTSTFSLFYAYGGGGGGGGNSGKAMSGNFGASGGGQAFAQFGAFGFGLPPQGKNGGGVGLSQAGWYGSGGGAGANGSILQQGSANGGIGVVNPIVGSTTGELVSGQYWICGGGASGGQNNLTKGLGGRGGGGDGGYYINGVGYQNANNATANTGGGGGGGPLGNFSGGNGSNGIIVLSVPTTNYTGALVAGSFTTITSGSNTIITWTYPGGTYRA
jgi:hypothetical protein